MKNVSAGKYFRLALSEETPLQIVGTINAYTGILATKCGFKALYLSGAGVANASFGLPDLGITTLNDVLEDVRRITSATPVPLLVDADTGWGGSLSIARTVKEMIKAGAAGIHIEDQTDLKRCGHRPGKSLVSQEAMSDRIKAAVDAKYDPDFVIMARTDSLEGEGLQAAIDRANAYVASGADMIFAEAITDLKQYKEFTSSVNVPVLANITEFGKTPYFTVQELQQAGIAMVLYPLSAFRAMSAAALQVYSTIRKEGTQKNVVDLMQTRTELYDYLDYLKYEKLVDETI
ncbi:MAG: methylisocitrate lyase [Gammaproteobacteria bacterium]|nr:methylisocitrate lyase [Gammaproteobacteria bacterium]